MQPSTGTTDRTPCENAPSIPPGPDRRRVLGLAVAAGAVGLVAACGGGSDEASPGGGTGSAPAQSSPPGDGGVAGELATTADVPKGGGVILQDKKIVITQPAAGEFKAFTAICTHQGCTVGSVENNTISCPCHGSQYNAADGSVKQGPAPAPLKEIAIQVEGNAIVES